MKRQTGLLFIAGLLFLLVSFTGCQTGIIDQELSEDDSYDASYLSGTYAEQLTRDGAETIVGSVEISGSENNYTVTVNEKKVVPNQDYENGYYIADRNITNTYPLGSDLGIVAVSGDAATVCTAEDFIKDHSGETDTLYTVYLIGDSVELILPLDPATVLEQ